MPAFITFVSGLAAVDVTPAPGANKQAAMPAPHSPPAFVAAVLTYCHSFSSAGFRASF